MKIYSLLAILSLVLLTLNAEPASDDITKELTTSNGKPRVYYLYVPSTIQSSSRAPLVVMLHGSNRTGNSLVEKWKDLAKKESFIIVGPDSQNTRGWWAPQDGPEYLRDVVEELKKKYPVDPRRVYLFGHSAGASFAIGMSLLESQYFAATAVHAGALAKDDSSWAELAKRKIPIFIQVGQYDEFFPPETVRATRDLLKTAGFPIELTEISGHDHWYYGKSGKINQAAWEFLKRHALDSEPVYRKYNF
jgi:poly(3-hydroxybutyrate) depolymerase